MRPHHRIASLALATLALAACSDRPSPLAPDAQTPAGVSAKTASGTVLLIPTSGTVEYTEGLLGELGGVGTTGTFSGAYSISGFSVDGGQLVAAVSRSLTFYDAAGNAIGSLPEQSPGNVPISVSGSCQAIQLQFGQSLNISLLGLNFHLDPVVYELTPEAGPGSAGGIVLCAIANLLDGGTLDADGLEKLAKLLNLMLVLY